MLSAIGLCLACADVRKTENMNQLVYGEGSYFEHWENRCYLAFVRRMESRKRLTA